MSSHNFKFDFTLWEKLYMFLLNKHTNTQTDNSLSPPNKTKQNKTSTSEVAKENVCMN